MRAQTGDWRRRALPYTYTRLGVPLSVEVDTGLDSFALVA
jgi:hypothetical protein